DPGAVVRVVRELVAGADAHSLAEDIVGRGCDVPVVRRGDEDDARDAAGCLEQPAEVRIRQRVRAWARARNPLRTGGDPPDAAQRPAADRRRDTVDAHVLVPGGCEDGDTAA